MYMRILWRLVLIVASSLVVTTDKYDFHHLYVRK